MSDSWKCNKKKFCRSMQDRIQGENCRLKGLDTLVLMSTKDFKRSVAGVVYKKTASDKGLMLNFCPWCGAPIEWVSKKNEEDDTGNESTKETP